MTCHKLNDEQIVILYANLPAKKHALRAQFETQFGRLECLTQLRIMFSIFYVHLDHILLAFLVKISVK